MRFWPKTAVLGLCALAFVGASWEFFLSTPGDFPVGKTITIEKGIGIVEISQKLKDEKAIKSRLVFLFLATVLNKSREIKSGHYFFNEPLSFFSVFGRLAKGDSGIRPIKVLIPEGATVKDIAESFSGFNNFNKEIFLREAANIEGYLFPDTYLFMPDSDARQIIKTMKDNFSKKAGDVGRDIVVVASLIEKEIPNSGDRKIISGILWKRLKIGMPLQVDAVFPYITGKQKISSGDLKIDSPYNTYLYKGLPPGPISNPGFDAIDAALNPVESPYLYYLSGKNSKTHFAISFAEHLKNKEKYLK